MKIQKIILSFDKAAGCSLTGRLNQSNLLTVATYRLLVKESGNQGKFTFVPLETEELFK